MKEEMNPIKAGNKKKTLMQMRVFLQLAEIEGFEPPHARTSAGFRNQSLQPLGYISSANKIIA